MKVFVDSSSIRFDMRTCQRGGTAVQVLRSDATEVFYGDVFASVRLLDLGFYVEMDSEPGEWRDEEWVRARALRAMREGLDVVGLARVIREIRQHAREEGAEEMRGTFRQMLGFSE